MTYACLSLLSLSAALAAAPAEPSSRTVEIEPGAPIAADAPWAIAPEGPRTLLESIYGVRVDTSRVAPVRDGNLVFDAESLGIDMLAELGLPLPALDHPPTPGVLYLAMDGLTLKPTCPGGQQANAALNCSPLVDKTVNFPKVVGGDATKQIVFEKLSVFYQAYDLVLTMERPPDYLPYTMAVIGGSAADAGHGGGTCGIANVACDGAKRNHVSLSFPQSCPGSSAEIAAQETAHNWGLEHTDVQADLMYPFVAGGSSFRDDCMDISHATGSGVTQCTYVHEVYCPEGGGEQQNSHGELLGVFGPRTPDDIAPKIVSITPADGSVFTTKDSFTVSASVEENSNFVGAKWTWLEGLPGAFQESGYTRCTNDVCTDKYNAWLPVEGPWDLIKLSKPPAGTYKFMFEVMDAYGNQASQTITFTVNPAEGSTGGDPEEGSTGTSDPTGEPDPTAGPDPTEGGDPTEDVDPSAGSNITGVSGDDPDSDTGMLEDDDQGCGCRTEGGAPAASLLVLLALGLGRRRRD